ncbi:HIT family protein [Salirhabdus salicampi]|uniref:HIT family protein n=1 Tax=Salirhabdus salicampi TaxID=476102 RepID=UPI0020C56F63|nr:HIT family protein [Salirhabdus salicampi]MCP8615512.1 HIT family protein [Salirhabdus salicampi]
MSDCIFCKIINGEIPSAKVYEDEHIHAFLDISQVTKGHTLIIPKTHTKDIFELESDVAEKLFARVPKVANAIDQAFKPKGLNILNNNREFAGQTVFHLHIHLIPRYDEHDGFGAKWTTDGNSTPEELQQIASLITDAL